MCLCVCVCAKCNVWNTKSKTFTAIDWHIVSFLYVYLFLSHSLCLFYYVYFAHSKWINGSQIDTKATIKNNHTLITFEYEHSRKWILMVFSEQQLISFFSSGKLSEAKHRFCIMKKKKRANRDIFMPFCILMPRNINELCENICPPFSEKKNILQSFVQLVEMREEKNALKFGTDISLSFFHHHHHYQNICVTNL